MAVAVEVGASREVERAEARHPPRRRERAAIDVLGIFELAEQEVRIRDRDAAAATAATAVEIAVAVEVVQVRRRPADHRRMGDELGRPGAFDEHVVHGAEQHDVGVAVAIDVAGGHRRRAEQVPGRMQRQARRSGAWLPG